MLQTILIAVAVVVVGILAYAASRPDTFRLQRSTTITAAAEKVFPMIADFHEWIRWSPWEDRDPALKRTYSGPSSGTGAVYAWEGNKNVGVGRMEIMETTMPSRVAIKLDFLKPFEVHNIAEFTLEPAGGGTRVTWAMHGPSPFMMKLMGVFTSMDKMVGKDFEAGLAKMKAAAEA